MYKLSDKHVFRISDNAYIPKDELNRDYQEYLIWLTDGNTPILADPDPVTVPLCTPYQFHEALNLMGLTDAVNSVIASDQSMQNAIRFAPVFRRDHPKIAEIAIAIGKTDADIDALFALAVTLSP